MILNGLTGRKKPNTKLRFFNITSAYDGGKEIPELKNKRVLVDGLENNQAINVNNAILSLRGTFKEDIFYVNSIEDITLNSSVNDLMELSSLLGFEISDIEYQELKQKLGKISLTEVIEMFTFENKLLINEIFTSAETALLEKIISKINENSDFEQTIRYLRNINPGLDFFQIAGIYNALKNRAKYNNTFVIEIIKENPYVLTQIIDNFAIAQGIAEQIADVQGMTPEKKRINLCASRIIKEILNYQEQGHCFMWHTTLYAKLLPDFTYQEISEALRLLTSDKKYQKTFGSLIIVSGKQKENREILQRVAEETYWPESRGKKVAIEDLRAVYLTSTFFAEYYSVVNMDFIKEKSRWDTNGWDERVERIHNLDNEQKEFLKQVARNRITLLTGGPGSGKTTVIKELIRLVHEVYNEIPVVIAPTALAAFRAAKETVSEEYAAQTIHRYAKLFTEEEDLIVNLDITPEITTDARLLIIDEASMFTPLMWRKVVNTITYNTNIVVAGDKNQLPPVGAGGVFPGLLKLADHNIPNIKKIELKKYYRGDKGIYNAMQAVLQGKPLPVSDNVRHIKAQNPEKMLQACRDVVAEFKKEGFLPEDILVLTPYRQSTESINTRTLNFIIQDNFNDNQSKLGNYKVGDIVVAVTNDYKDTNKRRKFLRSMRIKDRPDIYNGTKGTIVDIKNNIITVEYDMAGSKVLAQYNAEELPYYIELAYAMTIHKAQGGQGKHIVIVIPGKIHSKSLLFTAVSRCMQGGTITLISMPDIWEHEVKDRPLLSRFYHLAIKRFSYFVQEDPLSPHDLGDFYLDVNFL